MILARKTKLCAAVLGSAVLISACSSVLGFDSLTLLPEGGLPSDEASTQDGPKGDGSNPDLDGGNEAAPTCVGVDLKTDKKNCGRCNHDCLGADCADSVCKPIKLADGLAQPEGLVVSAADVFVAEYDQNRIAKFGKMTLGSCVAPPLPSSCKFTDVNVFRPTGMGSDGTSVYWANAGNSGASDIRSCPQVGCGGNAPTLIANLGGPVFEHNGNGLLPLDLVVKDGRVFWPESTGAAIRSAPSGGGGPTVTHLQNSGFAPLAIAVDDANIYFTDDTTAHMTQIASVPRGTAAAPKVIAETDARPYGISLTGAGNLFWTIRFVENEGSDGLVQFAPKTQSGGKGVGFAAQQNDPRALVVDAKNIYWVLTGAPNAETGAVVYCPLTGCPADGPIVLAGSQRVPKHLAQDDVAIYWSNEGLSTATLYDGQVFKVAKP